MKILMPLSKVLSLLTPLALAAADTAEAGIAPATTSFPPSLASYGDAGMTGLLMQAASVLASSGQSVYL